MEEKKLKRQRIVLCSALSVVGALMLALTVNEFNKKEMEASVPEAPVTTAEVTVKVPEIVVKVPEIIVTARTTARTTEPEAVTEIPTETEPTESETTSIAEPEEIIEVEPDETEAEITIEQNFPEPKKPEPPKAPELPEEETSNPDVKPTYEPEQTRVEQTTAAPSEETPYNGQKKDGKVYLEGFGWIVDEGGVAIGEVNEEMYQNGNKIGYFG